MARKKKAELPKLTPFPAGATLYIKESSLNEMAREMYGQGQLLFGITASPATGPLITKIALLPE